MSMDDFVKTLSEEQKAALLSALAGKEEVVEAEETNDITDDFRVVKNLPWDQIAVGSQ